MGDDIRVLPGWSPGALGDIVALHGRYYAAAWNFGPVFEAKVAADMAEFASGCDPSQGEIWFALDSGGRALGAVAVDGREAAAGGARLRWFILDQSLRGRGLGGALLDRALAFCRDKSYPRLSLWTFAGLDAARRLYESRGFVLAEEKLGRTWGTPVIEQRFELVL